MDIFTGNYKWQYVSGEGRDWLDGLQTRVFQGKRIKHSLQRSVYRLPEGVYVKEIRYKGLRSIFKTLTGGNAAKEGGIALKMKQRGLPVPEVLAFGIQKSFGKLKSDILVTREISDAKPFQDFVLNQFKRLCAAKKRELLKRFAGFVRTLHDAGIYHRDFHFNNVVIQEEDETFNFFILDLYAVRLKSGLLAWNNRIEQLGSLLAISWGRCSVSDRVRFIKHYGVRLKQDDTDRLFRMIREKAVRKIYRSSSGRSRRSVRNNTQFIQNVVNGFQIYGTRGLEYRQLTEKFCIPGGSVLENMDFRDSGGENNERKLCLNNTIYVINKHVNSNSQAKLRSLFCRLWGNKIWKRIWHLPYGIIRILQPVMMIQKKAFTVNNEAYLITKQLVDATQLHHYWNTLDEVGKIRMCASLGIFLGSMHRFGVLHGNLKWKNILVCPINGKQEIFLRGIDQFKMNRRFCRKKAEKDILPFLEEMERIGADTYYRLFFIKCWQKWTKI
jgi:tRNA A-37 threonylcarbamoyl transferase component Bud32